MRHTILQDSSFVIASINIDDIFYKEAIEISSELLKRKNKIRIVIPAIVFFETMFKLIQRGVKPEFVQHYLWKYLYEDEVLNVSLLETAAFRMSKKLAFSKIHLKTSDAIIALTGMEFESQILTFDNQMHKTLQAIDYKESYLCSKKSERKRFLKELNNKI